MTKILIIEDDVDLAELLKVNLEKQGWDITVANDGFKAVETVVNNIPDLIILDLNLPYIDGEWVISTFNKKNVTDIIPVIITSARDEKDIIEAKAKIGACAYMRKPLDIEKLVELIKSKVK